MTSLPGESDLVLGVRPTAFNDSVFLSCKTSIYKIEINYSKSKNVWKHLATINYRKLSNIQDK